MHISNNHGNIFLSSNMVKAKTNQLIVLKIDNLWKLFAPHLVFSVFDIIINVYLLTVEDVYVIESVDHGIHLRSNQNQAFKFYFNSK